MRPRFKYYNVIFQKIIIPTRIFYIIVYFLFLGLRSSRPALQGSMNCTFGARNTSALPM